MILQLNRIKTVSSRIIALSAILWLAACQPFGINFGGPVQVALLIPAGSEREGDILLAQNLENAARLAIADLKGVKVDLRVYHTAGNPGKAANMAIDAVNDGAKIIIGPLYAQAANAVGKAVARRGVNVLTFSNNTAIAGRNVFVLGHTFQNTSDRLIAFAQQNGRGKIMVVHAQNAAGEIGRDAVLRSMANVGAVQAGLQSYVFSQEGIFEAMDDLAENIKRTKPQSVFFTSDTAGALPQITQMMLDRKVDINNIRFMGLTRWDIPLSTLSLPGLQGGWYARPDPAMSEQFINRYKAAYGRPPHPVASLSYDAIAAIGGLVKSGRVSAFSTAALTQSAGFVGANGIFRFNRDGTNQRGLAIAQIKDKQMIIISPAPRTFGAAGY